MLAGDDGAPVVAGGGASHATVMSAHGKARGKAFDPIKATNAQLRKFASAKLPMHKVTVTWRSGPKKKKQWLSKEKLIALIQRQLKEAERKEHSPLDNADPSLLAHAFWASASGAQILPAGKINPIGGLGLASALAVGLEVHLWTYHDKIENLPCEPLSWFRTGDDSGAPVMAGSVGSRLPGIGSGSLHIRDARDLLSEADFKRMRRNGFPWGNIADVVRFRAVHAENREKGAWAIDLDTIWVRRPTRERCPSSSGAVYATCAARNRVGKDRDWWKWRYLQQPGRRSYMLPPLYFSHKSKILDSVVDVIAPALSGPPPKQYTQWLDHIEHKVIQAGCSGDFQNVETFHPVHNWVPSSALLKDPVIAGFPKKFDYAFNTAATVLRKSVAFNNPWQTTMPGKELRKQEWDAKLDFPRDSFFGEILCALTDNPSRAGGIDPANIRQYLSEQTFAWLHDKQDAPAPAGSSSPPSSAMAETDGPSSCVVAPTGGHQSADACSAPPLSMSELPTGSPPEPPQGWDEVLSTLVDLRNCAAMSVLWEPMPERGRACILQAIRKRGLTYGPWLQDDGAAEESAPQDRGSARMRSPPRRAKARS